MIVAGKSVIGLQIVTIEDGSVIETVDDIAYNPSTQRVEALLVSSGGLFSDAKAIDMDDVKNIGQDAVIVNDASAIQSVKELAEVVNSISDSNKYLVRTKVLTDEGKDLGTVSDILFDSATGEVESLEVSQGGFKSKKLVKPSDIVTVGKDATIVSAYTEQEFEQQAAETGVAGFVNDAKEQIAQTSSDIKDAVQDGAAKVKDATDMQMENLKEASNDAAIAAREKSEELRVRAEQTSDDIRDRAQDLGDDIAIRTERAATELKESADDAALLARERARDQLDRSELDTNYSKENNMSGLSDKISGKAKQAAGDISGNDRLKAEGKAEEVKGEVKDKAGEALDAASDKFDELKKNLKKS